MRYAIIKDGIVANIAESNKPLTSEWKSIPDGMPVSKGDTYSGGLFKAANGTVRLTPEQQYSDNRIAAIEETVATIKTLLEKLIGG